LQKGKGTKSRAFNTGAKMKDLTGKRFGNLTVIGFNSIKNKSNYYWNCKCDCGNTSVVQTGHLKNGSIKSCGCLRIKKITKHNESKTKLYHVFQCMKDRCFNTNSPLYKYYGNRGITICKEWLENYEAFKAWANANNYKEGLSIDRIDVNGNYEPSNCRWADAKTQNNNLRNNHILTFNGETLTLTQWAEKIGIKTGTLSRRINTGWTVEKALTTKTIGGKL